MSGDLRQLSDIRYKVLFGFKKDDPEKTGYFGENLQVVEDVSKAKWFPVRNEKRMKGFAKPEKWLDLINTSDDMNCGYKFHLVSYTRKIA